MDEVRDVFKVLSNVLSIRILKLVIGRGEPICVCEFSTAIGRPSYEISKSLKQLRRIGFLYSEKHGKYNYYSIPDITSKTRAKVFDVVVSIKDKTFEEDLKRLVKQAWSVKK